jgi:hypothetical protein
MRLGQLARKYDVSTQEIISYLKRIDPTNGTIHPNAKLDEHTEQLVAKHFDLLLDPNEEAVVDYMEEDNYEEERVNEAPVEADVEETLPVVEEVKEEVPTVVEVPVPKTKEEETITSDRLLELLESEENTVDLSKITRITAAKKELDGLKVIGKIELPEPKKKIQEKENDHQDKQRNTGRKGSEERPQVSADEAEKRRLWGKQKREENELRLERKRKEKEKQELKAMKEAHYKKKLGQPKAKPLKQKEPEQQIESTTIEVVEQLPEPNTVLGKFWKWLNT